MSGHLPWAEARLLQGPHEPSSATEQPRLNTAHAQSHRLNSVELFLMIEFNRFHSWFLEVCQVPLASLDPQLLDPLWFPCHYVETSWTSIPSLCPHPAVTAQHWGLPLLLTGRGGAAS